MPSSILRALAFVSGLVALGLFAYWFLDERDQSESFADALRRAGMRASNQGGNFLGWFGSLVAAVSVIIMAVVMELVRTGMVLGGFIESGPLLAGTVGITGLGMAALGGLLSLTPLQYGFIALVLVMLALVIRERRGASS